MPWVNVGSQVESARNVLNAEYANSFDEAYTLAIDTIETTTAIFEQLGKTSRYRLFLPITTAGACVIHLPKSLHRALAKAANREGVSLNQHLTNVLNYYSSYATNG